jgi:ribosomal protein S18 acetylase RimI-like enzyme
LVAAVWLQIQPGRVASLWSVGLGAGEPASAALALISLATAEAAAAGTRFVQTLLETDAGREAEWLRQASFQHITDLLYLVSLPETFPASRPGSDLAFECVGKEGEMGISETQMRRLAEIIRHTYIDTQDCRAVQGLRTVEDVLATYRSVGTFNPAQWFFVVHDQRDIGCLIMADHLLERNCELVYMGIVPESRGLSHGVEIVRFAQWQAGISKVTGGNSEQNGEHAVDRLVLAVDVANSPAIRMYATAGFQTWDRRSVFLREIAEKN